MKTEQLKALLDERVLILDGATGTMIQRLASRNGGVYRPSSLAASTAGCEVCNDFLAVSRPDLITAIHDAYIEAGADIISTDTFNANAISLRDYSLEGRVAEINMAAASIAVAAARRSGRRVLVAGSMGPTNRSASISPDVADPAARNIDFDTLRAAYFEQASALCRGGVDLLLVETAFDALNVKAALDATAGLGLPVIVSATIGDRSGRMLSGMTLEALSAVIEPSAHVVALGLNCSFGPEQLMGRIEELGRTSPFYISCHPNAGLPDELGNYNVAPARFAALMEPALKAGMLNIAGGCCGTGPEHIAALAAVAAKAIPHRPARPRNCLTVAGLQTLEAGADTGFINIGERCNVAGSRKFLRLIREGNLEEAAAIARKQVDDGALMIDVNMDDAMLDAPAEMCRFLDYIAGDPDIARVPLMIDSSSLEVIDRALRHVQGRPVVNSISLKEGEAKFLEAAATIRRAGAAVVVMAFDERGQADTLERRTEIAARSYRLLTEKAGFNPCDIIFDPNVMAVASGIESHNRYGLDFIEAVAWIKANLPGALTSGGVSNLSFAFRGHNDLREAMHVVFLYHAIAAGLDMAIVNPATRLTYDDIDPQLRSLIEDVILCRRPGAADELAAYAASHADAAGPSAAAVAEVSRPADPAERLVHALVKGDPAGLADDLTATMATDMTAVEVISGPLMEGMNRVGALFGEGKMFLPQVVKTARTMKTAVDLLRPVLESENAGAGSRRGKILFATVKGDVHDIGKNIVSIVLQCNNYEVIDLGVMVPADVIVDAVRRERPDIVCLSGLITPSLAEMVHVAQALERAGLTVPLVVGGATTSPLHTALKIAPVYSGPVVHAADASRNPDIAARLLADGPARREYIDELTRRQSELREGRRDKAVAPLADARANARRADDPAPAPLTPGLTVLSHIAVADVAPLVNYRMLLHAWRVTAADAGAEADRLTADARAMLAGLIAEDAPLIAGAVNIVKARSTADDCIIADGTTLPMMRQQAAPWRSLCDFISRDTDDYIGIFAVTAGRGVGGRVKALRDAGDEYRALLLSTLADRLAEAASEWLHRLVRRSIWGYAPDEELDTEALFAGRFTGIRPAAGYPCIPDQLTVKRLATLLPLDEIGISVTENGAMTPSASVAGLYIANRHARYFVIDHIGADQIDDYARRAGTDPAALADSLARLL